MFGVPAPRVLLIDQPENGRNKPVFCVEEKIEGESLASVMPQMDPQLLHSVAFSAGEILSDIHSITADRYGDLDKNWPIRSWQGYILGLEVFRFNILRAGAAVGLPSEAVGNAFRLIRKNKDLFKIDKPSLLHGDFTAKNMLVKDGQISGILDFQEAKGGDPVFDFAWASYFNEKGIPMEALKEGYKNKAIFNESFDQKIHVYNLVISLGLMDYYRSQKNQGGLSFAGKKLLAELAYFENKK